MNKITALFTGQAAQYQGMGRKWILEHQEIKQRFEQASDLLHIDLIELCINGSDEDLQKTELSQPAIFTLSFAMFEQFCSMYHPRISYLAGHSLGEITALTAAGVFTFEDALKFVYARGEAMSASCKKNPSTMYAVVNIDVVTLVAILKEYGANEKGIFIANYNMPRQTVLSGRVEALADFTKQIKGRARCRPLKVDGGFHSVYMKDAAENLKDIMNKTPIFDGKIPVVNANQMRFYNKEDDIRQLLLDQIVKPVNWKQSLEMLETKGSKLWIEFGPKNILRNTVVNNLSNAEAFSYDANDTSDLLEALKVIDERNQKTPNLIGLCLGVAVSTKNNCQGDELYQDVVVKAYNEMQTIHERVLYGNRTPTQEEERTALDLLRLILTTKQINEKEQNERINQIIEMVNS